MSLIIVENENICEMLRDILNLCILKVNRKIYGDFYMCYGNWQVKVTFFKEFNEQVGIKTDKDLDKMIHDILTETSNYLKAKGLDCGLRVYLSGACNMIVLEGKNFKSEDDFNTFITLCKLYGYRL
jgi:hypothetical protein